VPPKPTPAPATGDWVVQLGSFGEEANARRLAQNAGTFGYKAEVSSYRSNGRTLYRVRVGPQRTRAEADAAASSLRAHGITDARVVPAR
jgi:DedD protein